MSGKNVVFTLLGRNKLSPVFKEAGDDAGTLENRMAGWGNTASNVLIGAGAAAAAGLGKAISSAMDFDKTMRMVGIQTKLSGKGLQEMSDLAIKMGEDTVFSAADASAAMLELAKGGLTAAQMKAGALESTMTLAAAGELSMADAATYVANSMQMFGLRAEQADRVVTALAGGANASSASVESLGLALSQVGPGAKLAGQSIEETVAALSAFDAMGIKGSDAGTSLKTMFMRLVPQTEKAAGTMKELGLQFTTAAGEIKPMRVIAEELQQGLKDLSAEQKTTALTAMFGSDAYRAAALMAELGAEGIDKYTKAAKDQAAAQKLANAGMQGASGAWEQFTGSVETLGIELGTKLLPTFTKVANVLTTSVLPVVGETVDMVGRLPGPIKATAAALIGLTILGPKLGAFAATVRTNVGGSLAAAGASAGLLGSATRGLVGFFGGPWGIGLSAATVALGWLAGKFFESKAAVQELTEALKQDAGALGQVTRATIAKQLVDSGMIETAREAGVSFKLATAAALGQSSAITMLTTRAALLDREIIRLSNIVRSDLTPAQAMHLKNLSQERIALQKLIDKTKDQHDTLRESREAYHKQKLAEEVVEKAIGEHTDALDRNTKHGRENRKELGAVAQAALNQSEKLRENGKSWADVRDKMETARRKFIDTAVKMGVSRDRAQELAKKLGLIPGNYTARIHADTDPARNAIDRFVENQSRRQITIGWATASPAARREFHGATGGPVPLWGARGKDSVPAMLMPDEHVLTVDEVNKMGGHAEVERFRAALRAGRLPGYAKGGPVTLDVQSTGLREIARQLASISSPLGWAMSQAGKPYLWGGVGPYGYDCSGFMSAIVNMIRGRNPYSRLFATSTFPTSDFRPGFGNFMIGSFRGNPGHMAGTLLGVNVESRGGDGVVVGGSARGATHPMFNGPWALRGFAKGGPVKPGGDAPFDLLHPDGRYFLRSFDKGGYLQPGVTIAHNNTGRPERVVSHNEDLIDYDRLGRAVARAMKGVRVTLDGRIIGGVQARAADLYARGG